MILFHGSNVIVEQPLWEKGEETTDFGQGFYLTPDSDMAKKWACSKEGDIAHVSIYEVNLDCLNTYQFSLDKEWLEFVKCNRKGLPIPEKYSQYDLLIGPTADDRLFKTLNEYMNGHYTVNETLAYLNVAGFSNQYVFKNQEAINKACIYLDYKTFSGNAKRLGKLQADEARYKALAKLDEVQKLMTQRREAIENELFSDPSIPINNLLKR